MKGRCRLAAIGVLAAGMLLALGSNPGMAQSRAHVYLLRGLMNIFSLGMDTLGTELDRRGIQTTVTNYSDWETLADQAAARYHAGTEGPIILIGHSLGADAVMSMGAYLGRKGVPVALVVPFDCTDSFPATPNMARVINLTKHFYMTRGPGFRGSLLNVDLRGDPNIDHLNIDKSPRLHARIIGEVMAIVGAHRAGAPTAAKPASEDKSVVKGALDESTGSIRPAAKPAADAAAKPQEAKPQEAKPQEAQSAAPPPSSGTPVIALPEHGSAHPASSAQ